MTELEYFAERLSLPRYNGDVERAVASLGKSASWGQAKLSELRKRLGPQAV